MQPKMVVRTEAVIEILSFGVGTLIAIFASIKETEIWSSQCTPLVANECPVGATCPIPNARCPSDDPPSWDEGRLEMVWETIRCAPKRTLGFQKRVPASLNHPLATNTAAVAEHPHNRNTRAGWSAWPLWGLRYGASLTLGKW